MTTNPFRQPLRKRDVQFKTTVWIANEKGKDSSAGKTDFALNEDYLWLAYDFSVPLAWVEGAEPLGPGFLVAWKNPVTGETEAGSFCVRTMFGYNTAERDALVERIERARSLAESRPVPSIVSSMSIVGACEKCGVPQAAVYDFEWLFCAVMMWLKKPDRRTLCPTHARHRMWQVLFSNLTLGNLGIGIFISPILSFSAARQLRSSGALTNGGFVAASIIAFLPYGLVLLAVGASIWEAVNI